MPVCRISLSEAAARLAAYRKLQEIGSAAEKPTASMASHVSMKNVAPKGTVKKVAARTIH